MVKKILSRKWVLIIMGLILCTSLFTMCINHQEKNSEQVVQKQRELFSGSTSCANCHKSIYDSHIHTAHHLSSRPADTSTVMGKFETGHNKFVFDLSNTILVERSGDRLYQVLYVNGTEKKRRPFDIVIGSGTRGQSYLYWWKDTLFQLPLTYFTATNQWCNSPGYPGRVVFGRPVTSRCLECHTTYAQSIAAPDAQFEKFDHNIIYGVDCEKCHGSGIQHVQFQTQHPNEKTGKYIINPASFTRKQSLDLCALCHGGRLAKTKPSFEFHSGDTLANYFQIDNVAKEAVNIDVHGNQYGMLAASRCFKESGMTCMTCHNPHENEKGKKELFSQRCITCHNVEHNNFCKLNSRLGNSITKNCIDCHMPEQPSRSITVLLEGAIEPTSANMRSHFISIYKDATKNYLNKNLRP
ncbi:MAG: hypothetical protein JST58_16730 [Bacteroidetes bacterium]|nr:hypothetical protein [Bacteroidota bacterium]